MEKPDSAAPARKGSLSRPFKNRNFRLFWLGQSVSGVGNAMYRITLAWSVYQVTGSSADMGITLAVNILPQLALTLYGGALADRLNRRTLILICDCAAGVVTGLLAAVMLTGRLRIGELVGAAFALGVISSFFGPAYRPLLRAMLPVEDQQAATALYGAVNSIITVLGPLVAGLLLAVSGTAACFAVDAGTFLFSAGCSALMSIPTEKVGYATGIRKDVRDGLRLVVRTTWIRVTMLLSAVANLVCIAPLYVLLPSVIEKSGGDGRLLGVVTAIQATATAVFALVAGKYGHRVSRGVTVYALVITTGLGVCMLGGGISRVWLIVASMVVMGLGFAFNVVENALIQELIPQNFLARVYSVNSVTSFALAPLGYVISGVLARVIGDGPVLIGGGAILACSALLSALVTRWSLAGELVLPGEVRISRPIA